MNALVLDDDARLARLVAQVLQEDGFVVDVCATGADALRLAELGGYDLIVLDWMVPDVDGLSVCRELRRRGVVTPILVLSARGRVSEKVLGLERGADDYLTKPFDVEELLARSRALVRRAAGHTRVRCGELEIDRLDRQAYVAGQRLALTQREFSLLLRLAVQAEHTVTREDLIASVIDAAHENGTNILEVHVSRLRSKLGKHAAMLETVRGVGYRLRTGAGRQ